MCFEMLGIHDAPFLSNLSVVGYDLVKMRNISVDDDIWIFAKRHPLFKSVLEYIDEL